MSAAAPLRFLGVVLGGWVGLRVIVWMPQWLTADAAPTPERRPALQTASVSPVDASDSRSNVTIAEAEAPPRLADRRRLLWSIQMTAALPAPPARNSFMAFPLIAAPPPRARSASLAETRLPYQAVAQPGQVDAPAPPSPPIGPVALAGGRPQPANRLAGAAWLFLREGGGEAILPGGSLGGSQAGARLTYRLNGDTRRPVALSARVYAGLDRPRSTEVAFGLDWRPLVAIPLHLLAERRERLGRNGRSDWQLTLYGGGEARAAHGRLHLEAYGQAGVVGVDWRDLFADGAVKVSIAAGPAEFGGGAWGGAQPGVARLDIGPRATARLRAGGLSFRAEADWRFRVAGGAAPGSGPTLTLSAGF
jgi:hypothetical protein